MGKKESAEAQAERFRKRVEEMVSAGELNPTEADEALDRLVAKQSREAPAKSPPDNVSDP